MFRSLFAGIALCVLMANAPASPASASAASASAANASAASASAASASAASASAASASKGSVSPEITPSQAASVLETLPRHFEKNLGQTDGIVQFLSRGDGYVLFLTRTGAVLKMSKLAPKKESPWGPRVFDVAPEFVTLGMELAGANREADLTGEERLPGRSTYVVPTHAKWSPSSNHLDAGEAETIETAHFARVRAEDVYPGIDVVYYGQGRRLEYDFIVAPTADPKWIRVRFDGARDIKLDGDGSLVLETDAGRIVQNAPVAYQQIGAQRQPVKSHFVLKGREVGICVGKYDRNLPLTIDPVLSYGTYLGGNADDEALAVALDKDGNYLVAGQTESTDFPRQNPAFGTYAGSYDAFVTKISADGKTLVYSTYIGDEHPLAWDAASGIVVDETGAATVAGRLSMDVLLVKLDATGKAVFAIAFGGQSSDEAYDIALGKDDTLFLAGYTLSKDYEGSEEYEGFPVWPENAFQTKGKTSGDAFVCRIDASNPEQLLFVYSTYLGGNSFLLNDEARAIAADAAGNAYVAGITPSTDFPTTPSGRQLQPGGHLTDAFLVKLSPDGTQLLYGTYMGGGFNEEAHSVAADNAGNAYVTGWTNSHDFPTTPDSLGPDWVPGDCDTSPTGFSPCADAFIVKVDTTKSGAASFAYSTYLGGNSSDYGYGIAIDADGNAYIVGQTIPLNFPLLNQLPDDQAGGGKDAFIVKINPAGDDILYSTLFGGTSDDKGNAITLDKDRNVVIAGSTWSQDFPRPGAFQNSFGGGYTDAFLARITMGGGVPPVAGDVDGNGQFTMDDIKVGLRIAAGMAAGTADQVSRGDAAAPSGALNLTDIAVLLKKL